MSTNPPPVPPSMPPGGGQPYPYPAYTPPLQKKGISPVVWILGGLGIVVMLVVIAVVGAGFFIANKARQAGFSTEAIKRNPALATIRMMAALNPDIDVISYDEDKSHVTVREKTTGKTYTVDFDDAKRGKFVFREDGQAPVTITAKGDGDTGSIEMKGNDGATVRIGGIGPAKLPTWVPNYPNSEPLGSFAAESGDVTTGNFTFKTKDPADQVAKFYSEGFKQMGMKLTSTVIGGKDGGSIVTAEVEKKSAAVMLGSDGKETTVNVTFTSKK